MLGPSGSGKTTTLRMIAGFERPDARPRRARRRRRHRPAPVRARRQHGLPGLRALPAHVRGRQRRVRAAGEGREAPERRRRAQEALELVRLDGFGDRSPSSSRAASASGSRSRGRSSTSRGAAPRRAARRARPQAPAGDADRAEAHPAGGRDHLRLRHARPGRGADDERPHRCLQPGPDRADRHAGRGLRAAGERVRRRLRRRLEPARARRPAVHGQAREDQAAGRGRAAGPGDHVEGGRSARSCTPAWSRATWSTSTRAARSSSSARTRPASSRPRRKATGRVAWSPGRHTSNRTPEGGGRMRRSKLRYVALRSCACALGGSRGRHDEDRRERGQADHDRVGGLPRREVGEAVRAADRLQGAARSTPARRTRWSR